MLFDNSKPRHLPHLGQPEILKMGLSPLGDGAWIETDADFPAYHAHKLERRGALGERVYRALPGTDDAQREVAQALRKHLLDEHGDVYAPRGNGLTFLPRDVALPGIGAEPLWDCSLWVADDLALMQEQAGSYHLTAASLCSPSDWLLEEKMGRPLAEIHAPIPGFTRELTPAVDRFFDHLKVAHPVVRFNWSLQAGNALCRRPGEFVEGAAGELFYRSERQSLRRLPRTGAVLFTIRVYLHPLTLLETIPGAMSALFAAIDATEPALADYKDFEDLAPALQSYRP